MKSGESRAPVKMEKVMGRTKNAGKVILGLCGILFVSIGLSYGRVPGWSTDYRSALARAQKEGRPLVVDFGSPTCPACRMLENRTLSNPQVQESLQDFVRVYIDGNEQVELRESFGVQYYPTLIYLSPQGKVLRRQVGYVGPAEMTSVLQQVSASVPSREKIDRAVASNPPGPGSSQTANSQATSRKSPDFYEAAAVSGMKQNASGTNVRIAPAVNTGDKTSIAFVGRQKSAGGADVWGEERLVAQALPVPKTMATPAPVVNAPANTPEASKPSPTPEGEKKSSLPESVKKVTADTPVPAAPAKKAEAKAAPSPSPTPGQKKSPSVKSKSEEASKAASKKASGQSASKQSQEETKRTPRPAAPSVTAEDIENWFADAEAKLMAGYKKEARAMYAKIVDRDPENKFGKSDLAFIRMVALMVDRDDEQLRVAAHEKIKEFLKRYPNSPHKDYYTVVRAMLAADLGDYAEAHALLDRFPEEFPNSRYQDLARSVWQDLPQDYKSLQKKPAASTAGRSAAGSSNDATKKTSSPSASKASSSSAAKSSTKATTTKRSSDGGKSSSTQQKSNSSSKQSSSKSTTSQSAAKKKSN